MQFHWAWGPEGVGKTEAFKRLVLEYRKLGGFACYLSVRDLKESKEEQQSQHQQHHDH